MTHLDWLPNWLRKENLHEHKVFVTYEAIYDIVDAEDTRTLLEFDIVDMDGPVQAELRNSIQKEGVVIYEKA